LASAYYASRLIPSVTKKKYEIILLEKEDNVGGWMKTSENQGSINEWGPHSVRFSGKSATLQERNTLQLINELGLDDVVLPVTGDSVAAKNRLIYANEELHKLPASIVSASLPHSLHRTPLLMSFLASKLKKPPSDSETVHDVIASKFSPRLADLYASSFCRGVFAADSSELSMKAAFPALWKYFYRKPKDTLLDFESRHDFSGVSELKKSTMENELVKKAMNENWRMWSCKTGLQDFTRLLSDKICDKVEVAKNTSVESISREDNGKMRVSLKESDTEISLDNVDHVISALPSHDLTRVLRAGDDADLRKLSNWLSEIHFVDVAVVHVEFDGPAEKNLPSLGFGHLVPKTETSNLLGVIYDSCLFPEQNRTSGEETTRLTCMMGGTWFPQILGNPHDLSRDAVEQMAVEGVKQQLGISSDPVRVDSMICHKCIPTYRSQHTDLVNKMEYFIKRKNIPLSLIGNSYWGVSITDCIYNARSAVTKLLLPKK